MRPVRVGGVSDSQTPQDVLGAPAFAAIFLTLTIRAGSEADVAEALAKVGGRTRSVAFRDPEADLTCVVGIGADAWDRLTGAPRPRHLHRFEAIEGPTHTAPSTPGDLLIHLRARSLDLCFELADILVSSLREHADVVDEVHGFRYFDDRDLMGFVDGSANPRGQVAHDAVHIGAGDPAYSAGSYVIVQRYTHDLDAWRELSVEDQERAIGKDKLRNIELDDKPANSHVTLNTIHDDDGQQLRILRDNMPFGRVGTREFGTYFIGYAANPGVIETMLRRMFVGVPEGNHDRILDFSTAHTGCLFFVPSVEQLADLTGGLPSVTDR